MSLIAERVRKDRESAIFADNVFKFNLETSTNQKYDDTQYEYKDTLRHLDTYYIRFKKLVLNEQNVVTGLFPEYGLGESLYSTANPLKNVISKVRDSIYCALSSWSLSQAYKKIDDNNGRMHELSQSTVKCMRGILQCWMYQSNKLEAFKVDQSAKNALHSIFDLNTGKENEFTRDYEHLQIDTVSLYLITLVQMIASGLQIIYSREEVNFIQNLVFYVERAYRTPDFGMWERGTKYNNGDCELHASSIGMAKAALEIINGFNLYGDHGNYWSVIYVDIDAHNRNRTILETLLPRESNSKNTDCSLIPTLGFPCFALHDETIIATCTDRVKSRLEGKYGFKRFVRDGYGTEIEADLNLECLRTLNASKSNESYSTRDSNTSNNYIVRRGEIIPAILHYNTSLTPGTGTAIKPFKFDETTLTDKMKLGEIGLGYPNEIYYSKGLLQEFDGVESEWPLFYIFMIINAVFKKNPSDVQYYISMLEPLLKQSEDEIIIPKFYYVPIQLMTLERRYPGTQIRYSSPEYKEGRYFLWAQSLYLIANLLVDGLLHITDIDPMRKYLPGSERPKGSSRYSFFQGTASDLVVQVVPISESVRLQSFLSMYGILSQTPHQVEPFQIWAPNELLKAYSFLGANQKLGLTGRPPRPIGVLGTSKFYRICNTTIICHPLLLEVRDFYLSYDISLLLNDIKNEIMLLGKCWKMAGRPTFCFYIRESNIKSHRFNEILDLLADMRRGEIDGIKIRLCRLQNCISTGCTEHLDFVTGNVPDISYFKPIEELSLAGAGYTSFMERFPRQMSIPPDVVDKTLLKTLGTISSPELIAMYKRTPGYTMRGHILHELWQREGLKFTFENETLAEMMDHLIHEAGPFKFWGVVRYCSAMMGKMADSLAPSLTSLLVRGKQLSIGVFGYEEEIIDTPLMPNALKDIFYKMTLPHDIYQAVLQQELLLYVAGIINTKPSLFHGILTIRLGWLIHAIQTEIHLQFGARNQVEIHSVAPSLLKEFLYEVLATNKISGEHLSAVNEQEREIQASPFGISPEADKRIRDKMSPDRKISYSYRGPLRRRILEGSLNRVPSDLYLRVYDILQKTPKGITIHGVHLSQQPIISEMTRTESNFALTIERLLCQDPDPAHRQIVVELFMVISIILKRNPELSFRGSDLNVDELIREAYGYFKRERMLQLAKAHTSSHLPSIAEFESPMDLDGTPIDYGGKDTNSIINAKENQMDKAQIPKELDPNKDQKDQKQFDKGSTPSQSSENMIDFYDTPSETPNGTMVFLAKAVLNNLLSSKNIMASDSFTYGTNCSKPVDLNATTPTSSSDTTSPSSISDNDSNHPFKLSSTPGQDCHIN